jgi:hypothetical protein
MPKPIAADYPEYFERYISQVAEDDLQEALNNQFANIKNFLQLINEEKANYSYAPGKWSLKELLQHCIDTERIFAYRALCISRKEIISLPSFDENLYAQNSNANARSWKDLSNEFLNVRRSTQDLFSSFSQEMLHQQGKAGDKNISVESIGFITAGHITHHIKIAKERYLQLD